MRDQPRPSTKGVGAALLVAGLLVLYVLSLGPAYRLVGADGLNGDEMRALGRIYAPVWCVADQWLPLQRIVNWYAGGLWDGPFYGRLVSPATLG